MKLRAGEKGFTLIELVVSIAIAGFVVAAASMAIITIMRLSPRSSNWAIALRQVQDAGYWISRDVEMSQGTITIGDGNPTLLTMTVPTDPDPAHNKTITYQYVNPADSLKRLMRSDGTQQNLVADYITSITTSYSGNCSDNCSLKFTIAVTSGDVPITRSYEAMQRVPSQ